MNENIKNAVEDIRSCFQAYYSMGNVPNLDRSLDIIEHEIAHYENLEKENKDLKSALKKNRETFKEALHLSNINADIVYLLRDFARIVTKGARLYIDELGFKWEMWWLSFNCYIQFSDRDTIKKVLDLFKKKGKKNVK